MSFERAVGFILLALLLVCYIFGRITRNVNWAMLGRYLRHMLSTW
jgi:hypothetical protein